MFKFVVPSIILVVSVIVFLVFTKPAYNSIASLRVEAAAYDQALTNSKKLQEVRDELTAKYNSMSPDDLERIEKLLPDTIDNVRLVIDIKNIAATHGLIWRSADFDTENTTTDKEGNSIQSQGSTDLLYRSRDYQRYTLGFSVEGNYDVFQEFLNDLEKSLRIVDISKLSFSAVELEKGTGTYRYDVDIQTYWLTNR